MLRVTKFYYADDKTAVLELGGFHDKLILRHNGSVTLELNESAGITTIELIPAMEYSQVNYFAYQWDNFLRRDDIIHEFMAYYVPYEPWDGGDY